MINETKRQQNDYVRREITQNICVIDGKKFKVVSHYVGSKDLNKTLKRDSLRACLSRNGNKINREKKKKGDLKKVALLYGVELVKCCFMCYNVNTLNLTALTSEE